MVRSGSSRPVQALNAVQSYLSICLAFPQLKCNITIMAQNPSASADVCSFVPDESVNNGNPSGATPHTHSHDHGSHSHDHSHDASSGPFTLAEHGHTHEHLEHAGQFPLFAALFAICGFGFRHAGTEYPQPHRCIALHLMPRSAHAA